MLPKNVIDSQYFETFLPDYSPLHAIIAPIRRHHVDYFLRRHRG
ncbi:MAG: hypothetical protein R3B96_16705 [Pirellulaceae bacterium]